MIEATEEKVRLVSLPDMGLYGKITTVSFQLLRFKISAGIRSAATERTHIAAVGAVNLTRQRHMKLYNTDMSSTDVLILLFISLNKE